MTLPTEIQDYIDGLDHEGAFQAATIYDTAGVAVRQMLEQDRPWHVHTGDDGCVVLVARTLADALDAAEQLRPPSLDALLSGEGVREALSQALDDIARLREAGSEEILSNPPYTRPDAGEVG